MYSLFFNSEPRDINAVVTKINHILNCSLVDKSEDSIQRYQAFILDIEFVLIPEHGLENDCGIDFESYYFEMDVIKLSIGETAKPYGDLYKAAVKYLAFRIAHTLDKSVVLVEDLQKIISAIEF